MFLLGFSLFCYHYFDVIDCNFFPIYWFSWVICSILIYKHFIRIIFKFYFSIIDIKYLLSILRRKGLFFFVREALSWKKILKLQVNIELIFLFQRERKQKKLYSEDWALGDDEIEGRRSFNLQEKLENPLFATHNIVREMHGSELTVAYFQKHGFNTPLLFKEKSGLGKFVCLFEKI